MHPRHLLIGGWRGAYNTFLGGYCARCIENQLHWQLDVSFREDANRVENRHGAENLALMRKLALGLVKQHPRKDSVARKRKAAALNTDFLAEILTGANKADKI